MALKALNMCFKSHLSTGSVADVSFSCLPIITRICLDSCCFYKQTCIRTYKQPTRVRRPKKRIYYGYVDELFTNRDKQLQDNLVQEVPNYSNDFEREGNRRQAVYERKKMLKKLGMMNTGSNPVQFTDHQITYIQNLHQGNPTEWTKSKIASSLGANIELVNSILKKKVRLKLLDEQRCQQDIMKHQTTKQLKVHASNVVRKEDERKHESERQTVLEHNQSAKHQPFGPWFKHFQRSSTLSGFSLEDQMEVIEDSSDVLNPEDYDEHSDELYNYDEVITVADDDDLDDEDGCGDAMKVDTVQSSSSGEVFVSKHAAHSSDNVNFYDSEGRFLYKVC